MPVAPLITSPVKRINEITSTLPASISLANPGKITTSTRPRSVNGSQYTTPRKSSCEVDHVAGILKN